MVIVLEPGLRDVKVWKFAGDDPAGAEVKLWDAERFQNREFVSSIVSDGGAAEAIAFHFPFGRDIFRAPERIKKNFVARFKRLVDWYPLYVPQTAGMIEQFRAAAGDIPMFAFFDTSFFTRLPHYQRYYALPFKYCEKDRIRKWGFHGILHEAAAREAGNGAKVISIVMDRRTTVSAVSGGKPLLVSLGNTPFEGVMGRTACGDLDPGIVLYLLNDCGLSLRRIDRMLKEESGFQGMTGYDLTLAEFVSLYGKDRKVDLAFSVYENQILKYAGEGITAMGGVDAVVFSGKGLDAFSPVIYSLVKKISFLGISLAEFPWRAAQPVSVISSEDSRIRVLLDRKPASWFILGRVKELLRPS